MPGITPAEGIQHQGRQGKLVDKLGFIIAVTEIRYIIFMRHIGFGNDHYPGGYNIENSAKELHNRMGLFKMYAAGADCLP
ncbi:hypothetical protein ES705_47487 [subsurface metagenome]